MRRALMLTCWMTAASAAFGQEPAVETSTDLVGRWRDDVIVTPVNQILTPYGRQVDLPGLRPQALALSPDGKRLVVSGKTSELLVIDVDEAKVLQRVALPSEEQQEPPTVVSPNILKPDRSGQVSYTGLKFSHDGKRIYLSNVDGSIKVFAVADDGAIQPTHVLPLPAANAPRRKAEIPSGLALSEDDARIYVCGNLSNKLLEINTADGALLRSWDVGVAPYDVVLAGGKAFVSNWGGRRPGPGDLTGPAGRGTEVRVDPVRHIASEGSVSIIDLGANRVSNELATGLHASALAVSPDRRYVVCANAGSDHLSLIDVAGEAVVETVWTKIKPSDLFGASPNALAFEDSGRRLFVANGTQNAVAVFHFDPDEKGDTKLEGLIPAGWFPGAIAYDASRKALCVANIKGLPSVPKTQKDGTKGFNSHHYQGSVSLMPLPSAEDLPKLSERAARNLRRGSIDQAALPPREGQAPRAVPERIGEPSLIEHVVYVIKENRTYDQVLGSHQRGRGRADLCIFGPDVTPNQFKLVDEFVLLDNTYCAGILSADGHQWSTTAFGTDYMEKSFAGFPRSYPDGMGEDDKDALAYSPAGFLWDNAVAHKKTIRNYGEFMVPKVRWRDEARKGTPDYLACYRTWKGESQEVVFESEPAIESIRPYSPTDYVGWEMAVPDQYRADFIIRELKEFEEKGEYPSLVIICLPNDHTSGTSVGSPTPASCMADNDLAFGRIVEALSHSRFWNKMAVFAIEDDPQAGWDHVSGYRTTAYCASPYAKRNAVVSTQYNTTSMIRTIEQILGLPPMNQFDASATPMFDCFTDEPDPTPFVSVANRVPLDQMNPDPKAIRDPHLREDALLSAQLNFREVDKAPEDVLNRILWRALRGSAIPYPEWAITAVVDDDDD
ncbi:beta-propeller fold lactonase family protein [Planctomyces sp. SH-PL62]|uniref:beta-propeller fold lactonase family protein n=1 Tax=Planctomyces sp. SH-PL62 TaxID=1636152 RepID=UPI00078BB2D3|nr:beta-propeller fold lactonase family protein [Planctomyces sp. SH-PL62]AMV38753.1 Phosphoesterase family protein [Planctomyces sp. SH-PL62]